MRWAFTLDSHIKCPWALQLNGTCGSTPICYYAFWKQVHSNIPVSLKQWKLQTNRQWNIVTSSTALLKGRWQNFMVTKRHHHHHSLVRVPCPCLFLQPVAGMHLVCKDKTKCQPEFFPSGINKVTSRSWSWIVQQHSVFFSVDKWFVH